MPVTAHSYAHFNPVAGNPPAAPTAVTSITADASATVSFRAGSPGDAPVSSWTVTPYIGGAAQSPVTTGTGSATTITGSDGNTYTQVPVTGLANGTAYTFSVHGTSSVGAGSESAQSGANTPLAGLVFGDDFGGSAGGPVDPEWWIYSRCGFLAQSEVQYYLPSQVTLDGSSNLALTGIHTSYTGPGYPSAGGGSVTQPWRSGAAQSNTRSYAPAADGNTMTFETRFQVCPGISGGMWPGLFWLEGTDYLAAWKTDPAQSGWNTTGKAEIDVAEFGSNGQTSPSPSSSNFLCNLSTSGTFIPMGGAAYSPGVDCSAAMHVYSAAWKGTSAQSSRSVRWYMDAPYVSGAGPSGGTQVTSLANNAAIPVWSSCAFFLLLYLQILTGNASSPQTCLIDYVRVYDQNIG